LRNGFELIAAQVLLTVNDIIITTQWATGYVTPVWDIRMHVLIDTSSCLTLVGQSLSKTAFAVTLLKLTKGVRWQQYVLWFCIVTMNAWNIVKVRHFEQPFFQSQRMLTTTRIQMVFEWGRSCGVDKDFGLARLPFCLDKGPLDDFKKGGNSRCQSRPVTMLRSTDKFAVYNVLMDFVFAAFPWIITWHLNMKMLEKIGLCAVMSLVHPQEPPFTQVGQNTNPLTRAWSSQSSPRSAHTGNIKATPKTNGTSGVSACRISGTPPK
jgi:hypothetical protein